MTNQHEQNEPLLKRIGNLKRELEFAGIREQALNEENEKLIEENRKLNEENGKLNEENSKLESKYARLRDESEQRKRDFITVERNYDRLYDEHSNLKRLYENLRVESENSEHRASERVGKEKSLSRNLMTYIMELEEEVK